MFETGFNLVLIILGFGVLIFVHETGHFLAAKWAGIRTEVFAIGMGTAVVSWRKGIGFAWGSTHDRVVARAGRAAHELSREQLEQHEIGCTEYSLRWLPIGGFVKMLGQDDADPSNVSTESDTPPERATLDPARVKSLRVVELRKAARRVREFPIKGRELARANREEILDGFRALGML